MTDLGSSARLRMACCPIIAAALVACAGAHASKAHARIVRPAHGAARSITAPRKIPAAPEVKPLVGELMA
jgi:hypothetical protein